LADVKLVKTLYSRPHVLIRAFIFSVIKERLFSLAQSGEEYTTKPRVQSTRIERALVHIADVLGGLAAVVKVLGVRLPEKGGGRIIRNGALEEAEHTLLR
jgi:hypothetical protein